MLPLRDTKSPGTLQFWVVTIILVNVLIFIFELFTPNIDQIFMKYALVPDQVHFSDIATLYPLITSQFLHGGFLHIISNMWFLWVFGDNVEDRFGHIIFPLFYLFSGIIAGLTEYLIDPNSSIPILGASGAIAGILGAYFALFPKNEIRTFVFIIPIITITTFPAYLMLFYWFLLQVIGGLANVNVSGGVAWFAHIGGFTLGWILGRVKAKSL